MTAIVNIPLKLNRLYKSEKCFGISNDTQLAKKLGIAKQNISNWKNSEDIPEPHISNICKLYQMSKEDFLSPDLDHFDKALGDHRSAWSKLFDLAESNQQEFSFVECRSIDLPVDKSDFEGNIFKIGEEFRLQLNAPRGWWVVLLLKDTERVKSLCPHERLKNNRVVGQQGFIIPAGNFPFTVEGPVGQHYFLAIFTQRILNKEIYQSLCNVAVSNYTMEQMLIRLNEDESIGERKILKLSFGIANE